MRQRGLTADFLSPKYETWRFAGLPELEVAAERIIQAVESREKILIYGDYDADGVTASALMLEVLEMMGAEEVGVMLPDRFKDGYGMSKRLVQRAERERVKLVITVDCGSNNAEIISELRKVGTEVVVTDHHEVLGELPKAVAVVNPKRRDTEVGAELKDLAGVGVAFMVAVELMRKGKIKQGQEKWLLDLVLIGTICDSMRLTGVNRILGVYGMKVLGRTRRVGLVELMRRLGVKKLSAETVGFQIGPRLNAAGRMESAEVALRLLRTKSRVEAASLVMKLEELNERRRAEQDRAVKEAEMGGVGEGRVIVARGEWHEGVLGIIAGRLLEKYLSPSFALAETEEGMLKGSGRSFGEFNLAEALEYCREVIVKGGGHGGACGVTIVKEKFEDFKQKMNEYYESLKLSNQERFLEVKEDLAIDELGEVKIELVDEIMKLEPFGEGNLEPVLKLEQMTIAEKKLMGGEGEHVKLVVRDRRGGELKLLAFFAEEDLKRRREGEVLDLWVKVMANEWRGGRMAEGRIVRWS